MDAIVEFDSDFRVTNINAAAKKIFCREYGADDISFNEFITQQSRGKLIYLIEELGRRPEDKQSIWIPEGLVGIGRSEEHTSELQSQSNLVCRLLLEKKKKKK